MATSRKSQPHQQGVSSHSTDLLIQGILTGVVPWRVRTVAPSKIVLTDDHQRGLPLVRVDHTSCGQCGMLDLIFGEGRHLMVVEVDESPVIELSTGGRHVGIKRVDRRNTHGLSIIFGEGGHVKVQQFDPRVSSGS